MLLYIVVGFTDRGKAGVIQYLINRASESAIERSLSLVLNTLGEEEVLSRESDSDSIQFFELREGCPCCTLSDGLTKLLDKDALRNSDIVVIEVSGMCEAQQLVYLIKEEIALESVVNICVVETGSLQALMDVAPVLKRNITYCDVVVVVKEAGDGDTREMKLMDGIIELGICEHFIVEDMTFMGRAEAILLLRGDGQP